MFITISRLFLLSALAAPLWLVRSTFFPFISVKVIFFRIVVELALLFFVAAVILSKNPKEALKKYYPRLKNPIVLGVIVFAIVAFVTALTGSHPLNSIWSNFERGDGAFQIIHYALFFILTALLLDSKKHWLTALWIHVVVSFSTSLYALAQLLYRAGSPNWVIATSNRVSGTLGNPSYLAAYLIFTLVVIIYLMKETKSIGIRWMLSVPLLFEAFIILKTGTRGAFLAIIIAGLVSLGINLFLTKQKKTKMILLMALLLPVALMVVFFTTAKADVWQKVPLFGRLIDFTSAVTDIQPRIWTWTSAVSAGFERPLLGWGLENFSEPFDSYYNPKHFGIESFFDRTHNVFLEYFVSGGVVLLLAWLSIFFFYYRDLVKRKKDWWWAVLFSLPVAYFIQGFFLFDVLAIYLVLFLFLGLFIFTRKEVEPIRLSPASLNPISTSYLIVALAIILPSIYLTGYRPLQKNLLLATALQYDQMALGTPIKTQADGQAVLDRLKVASKAYDTAYNYPSVVGQEETVGSMMKFALASEEKLQQIPALANYEPTRMLLKSLADKSHNWLGSVEKNSPGTKSSFLGAVVDIQFSLTPTADGKSMQILNPEYLNRGRSELENLFSIAPTRIEFVRVLLRLSQITGDQTGYIKWLGVAQDLRPDIDWSAAK
ncbi:MAG: hypothetical protein COU10_02780 [Candidatus Harrisonbacteria bacterium CG10_big_fil_rev_8_21_14_0_10_45_28]|uniref:O-antigen ligase-related domain-containing protein n=1 Tax=Candidatus Harrisonbacteria bacterium CG10_big_fil_rev_8_21_14_0_10_45_28 TaxID=1974586 RepID=A0A2H0UMX4_9BACT|nr:MAG: hypothetical protein COU10_02780 [Candidatus Harrisonbacteria bacterium CG10_big_fil_rev_8_21_14_0_10_45_28]